MVEKVIKADPQHEVTYQELAKWVGEKTGDLPAIEVLAIVSNFLGKLIAMQDQRKYDSALIMRIVSLNIEVGNKQAIDELRNADAAGNA